MAGESEAIMECNEIVPQWPDQSENGRRDDRNSRLECHEHGLTAILNIREL